MAFTPITVTGGPYKDGEGNVLSGWIIMRLTQAMSQSGGLAIMPTDIRIPLDGGGNVSQVVMANDDPETQQEALYEVAFELGGGFNPALSLFILVPSASEGGTIALTDCPRFPNANWSGGSGGGGGGGGGGGSGGGSSNDWVTREFDLFWDSGGPLTPELYSATVGDIIHDWGIDVITAVDGITPQFDLGDFAIGGNGLLVARGLAPMPLWAASAALASESGLRVSPPGMCLSWAAACAAAGLSPEIKITSPNRLYGSISQDGTAQNVATATMLGAAVSLPVVVTANSTDQFVWQGTTDQAPAGGGGAPAETFTIAPSGGGGYTTMAALVNAVAAATGSLSGERFDSVCVPSISGSSILFTAKVAGAGAQGNAIEAAVHDASANLGVSPPGELNGGIGGSPGSTQGHFRLYVVSSTPG